MRDDGEKRATVAGYVFLHRPDLVESGKSFVSSIRVSQEFSKRDLKEEPNKENRFFFSIVLDISSLGRQF